MIGSDEPTALPETWQPPFDARFELGSSPNGPWAAPAGTPKSLTPDDYRAVAAANWVSDLLPRQGTPMFGGVIAYCVKDLTVGPSTADATIRVTFRRSDPCVITVS